MAPARGSRSSKGKLSKQKMMSRLLLTDKEYYATLSSSPGGGTSAHDILTKPMKGGESKIIRSIGPIK